jgi:hypothetical protein
VTLKGYAVPKLSSTAFSWQRKAYPSHDVYVNVLRLTVKNNSGLVANCITLQSISRRADGINISSHLKQLYKSWHSITFLETLTVVKLNAILNSGAATLNKGKKIQFQNEMESHMSKNYTIKRNIITNFKTAAICVT